MPTVGVTTERVPVLPPLHNAAVDVAVVVREGPGETATTDALLTQPKASRTKIE